MVNGTLLQGGSMYALVLGIFPGLGVDAELLNYSGILAKTSQQQPNLNISNLSCLEIENLLQHYLAQWHGTQSQQF